MRGDTLQDLDCTPNLKFPAFLVDIGYEIRECVKEVEFLLIRVSVLCVFKVDRSHWQAIAIAFSNEVRSRFEKITSNESNCVLSWGNRDRYWGVYQRRLLVGLASSSSWRSITSRPGGRFEAFKFPSHSLSQRVVPESGISNLPDVLRSLHHIFNCNQETWRYRVLKFSL